jgi:hypothetical protein
VLEQLLAPAHPRLHRHHQPVVGQALVREQELAPVRELEPEAPVLRA